MLTPAIFEDRMRAIRMSAKDTPTMLYQAHQLMAEALDDLGYTVGIRVFDAMIQEQRRRTEDDGK